MRLIHIDDLLGPKLCFSWVDSDRKFIYVKIPKTGGTSMMKMLGLNYPERYFHPVDTEDFFVFTMIRNPIDRFFSGFNELCKRECAVTKAASFYQQKTREDQARALIEELYIGLEKSPYHFDTHVRPQTWFMSYDNGQLYKFDKIYLMEDYQAAVADLKERGYIASNQMLPHLNKSNAQRMSLEDHYIQLLEEIYKDDIKWYNTLANGQLTEDMKEKSLPLPSSEQRGQTVRHQINPHFRQDGNTWSADKALIDSYISDSRNPFLVSFPRTGSHWLRMLMELYFEKPSLTRIFYHGDATEFTCYHTHDVQLTVARDNVIYLWRNPVDTVYSQLNYYKEDVNDKSRIAYWANLYAKHLARWLLEDQTSKSKVILTYEGMKSDLNAEFQKLCDYLQVPFDAEKLQDVARQVSKEKLKAKNISDKQVVNISDQYEHQRDRFKSTYRDYIYSIVNQTYPSLQRYFPDAPKAVHQTASYYSQHGEDVVIDKLFAGKDKGFFIEIGCIDGKRFSNTLHFAEKGWKGLCVEAHPDYIPMLKRNRPESIVVHAAVTDQDRESIPFYANSRGSLSTVDHSMESHFRDNYGDYFTGFEEKQVAAMTLKKITEAHCRQQSVDFISLDIEGHEVEALAGHDFSVCKPRLWVIECDSQEHKNKIEQYLLPQGYHYLGVLGNNAYYSLEASDVNRVPEQMNADLIHTEHPCDNNGDVHVPTVVRFQAEKPSAALQHHDSGQSAKIVGLIAARNEENLIAQCIQSLSQFTDAIVYLDDCSTDNTLQIVKDLATQCRIERILTKDQWHRDEPGDRNAMLDAGRQIGGTHFVVLDADEAFTSNLLLNNNFRNLLLSLSPGDKILFNWIALRRSTGQYRSDDSIWTHNYKDIVFCDDRQCSYSSEFIHTPRTPRNLSGRELKLEGYDYGLLHLQFVNWENLLLKQAWYRCIERIRHPEKSVARINARYAPSKDETNIALAQSDPEWFKYYPDFDHNVYNLPDTWRRQQVTEWFNQYGIETFKNLDIWDVFDQTTPNAISSDTRQPDVSIIMSCHNAADYLGQTLDSILTQTLTNWQLLAVDDGSSDQTPQILKSYADKDPRIKVYTFQDQQGPYVRRNFAIEKANSEYISIQDADDIMMPQKLQRLYEEISADPSLGIVGSFYRRFLDTYRGPDFGDALENRTTHEDLMAAFHEYWYLCWHGSAIIRKSMFDLIGPYDIQPYGSDTFWLAKAGLYGLITGKVRFKNIPEYLTCKREHAQSQTGKVSPVDPRSRRHRLQKYYRQKLLDVLKQVKANPAMDVAEAIKHCTCSEFIPMYQDQFQVWESAPLDGQMIQLLTDQVTQQFQSQRFVSCLIVANEFERIAPDYFAGHETLGFIRAMAYYAAGDDQSARRYMNQEVERRQSSAAQEFIGTCLSGDVASVSAAQRVINIHRFLNPDQQPPLELDKPDGPGTVCPEEVVNDGSGYRVSAIVSTYSSERYIRGCLQDLIEQTLYKKGQLEIVVINSNSPENEDAIIREYAEKYPHINYIRTDFRETLYAAWNRGIKASRGQYITNANTDDRHAPEMMEKLARTLDENPDVSYVYSYYYMTKIPNQTWQNKTPFKLEDWQPEHDREFLLNKYYCGPQPMWRRSVHDEYGYFDGRMKVTGDYEFVLRISQTLKFKLVPEPLGLFYYTRDNLLHTAGSFFEERDFSKDLYQKFKDTVIRKPLKDNPPQFSVVMRNDNNGSLIAESIESVIHQTSQDWELVIVDDASGDDSIERIKPYLDDPRIRLVQNAVRQGPAMSTRTGMTHIQGQLFGILDSMDTLAPNTLAVMTEAHQKHPQAGLIYSQHTMCDENLVPIQAGFSAEVPTEQTTLQADVAGPFQTFKLMHYLKTGLHDTVLNGGQDRDITYKMEEVTCFHFVPEPLYFVRRTNPQSRQIDRLAIAKARINACLRRSVIYSKKTNQSAETLFRHLLQNTLKNDPYIQLLFDVITQNKEHLVRMIPVPAHITDASEADLIVWIAAWAPYDKVLKIIKPYLESENAGIHTRQTECV